MTSILFHDWHSKDCGPNGDGLVEGTSGNDLIDYNYTGDPEGDRIDHNDALLPGEGPQDDIVLAGAGNDTVKAGVGNDEIYGGTGNDSLYGEAGDDVAYGEAGNDHLYGGTGNDELHGDGGNTGHRESFNWSQVKDTDYCGKGNVDDGESLSGDKLVQDTGDVKVTITIPTDAAAGLKTTFDDEKVDVSGIDGGGETVNSHSSLDSYGTNGHGEAHYFVDFDQSVANVQFTVSDIDADRGQVTIHAWDANGNPIEVSLTGGSEIGLSDTDGVAGNDTATGLGNGSTYDPNNSILVSINGPVSKIEIIHENIGSGGSAVNVSDIFFDTIGDENVGDDYLDGGDGDDTLYGDGGQDVLIGGKGADHLYGGADRDVLKAGAGDHADGGSEGNDYDILDLTGQGYIKITDLTPDSNGNGFNGTVHFVNADGTPLCNPDGSPQTMTFVEIEEIKGTYCNGGPTANDDTATVDEDSSASINVLANDTDPDGDTLTVTSASAGHGVVTIGGDGKLTYTPDPNYNGEDTITYTISDGHGHTDTATVGVTVSPVNDLPVAEDDNAETDEDSPVVINVLGNDSDVDGDTLSVTSATAGHGTVTIGPDGKLTYVPDADYNGPDEITYSVSDGHGGTDTATVSVTVNPVNDDPVANDDSATTDEDTPVEIDVLGNDTDVDGDPLSVTTATADHGTVSIGPDGKLTYTPDPDYNGPDTITYTVSDGTTTDTGSVAVTVTPVNDDPVAVDDTAAVDFNTPTTIDVLYNDTDVDGDTLTILGTPTALHGSVTVNPDGTLVYTPDAGYAGPDTISYAVSDGNGGTDTAEVDVTVGAAPLDGIVEGTSGDDLIDDAYLGDPEGDRIDHLDEILPGEGPNDDIVYGYGGNDTIVAGEGNDDVYGGTGDDTIYGGAGDDILRGEEGNDTVYGGEGDDVIDTSVNDLDHRPDRGYPGLFTGDSNPFDDRDTVYGGAGNDTISTGDDNDLIFGGAGNDTIDGGFDDDEIHGDDGDDFIIGGEGSDAIFGGAGNDDIWGGLGPVLPDSLNIPDATDLRPDNGIDVIHGGDGDDVIHGQDDNDVLYGDAGNDTIYGGIDNDLIYGGTGNDTLYGDDGDDEIYGDDGDDLIEGGAGNDYLNGGEGDDTIYGGAGNDDIQGHAGNDTLYGGDGDDNVKGSLGDDYIYGGAGDDEVEGANGNDHLFGDEGNDWIKGGQDDDTIYGGSGDDLVTADFGDDTIHGDDGDDELHGDAGKDTFYGGAGADQMFGEDDEDTFIGGTAGDFVDGGEGFQAGHIDYDTLDLTGAGPLHITYDPSNAENGIVEFRDNDGNVTGTMEFKNIENVIPCFTPGSLIATPKGERPVEDLKVGDKIITRDNGIQEIRWLGAKALDWRALGTQPHLKPVLIRKGSLGHGLPERDMLVSPNHRVLVANDQTQLYFEEREVLVAAKHLVNNAGVSVAESLGTTYIHFMFDHHEVVLSDGSWTESFQPGDYTLKGIGNAQRAEILGLFPELKDQEGIDGYAAARRTLKKHEAQMLWK